MVFLHKDWKDVIIMKQDKVIHTSMPFNMVSKLFPSIVNTNFGTIEPYLYLFPTIINTCCALRMHFSYFWNL